MNNKDINLTVLLAGLIFLFFGLLFYNIILMLYSFPFIFISVVAMVRDQIIREIHYERQNTRNQKTSRKK